MAPTNCLQKDFLVEVACWKLRRNAVQSLSRWKELRKSSDEIPHCDDLSGIPPKFAILEISSEPESVPPKFQFSLTAILVVCHWNLLILIFRRSLRELRRNSTLRRSWWHSTETRLNRYFVGARESSDENLLHNNLGGIPPKPSIIDNFVGA